MVIHNYFQNYIKIYLSRIASISTGFFSMLIVVPKLSSNPELYGIYAFCMSFTLYLNYADIGFLSAGQKYAAEAFSKLDIKDEIEILGFTGAILILMLFPFSVVMIYFSFNPSFIIKNLSTQTENIVGSLFLIMGVFQPFLVITKRLLATILSIRVKDYVSLRLDVLLNLIKIFSVFYFFSEDNYLIVEYYMFLVLVSLLDSILLFFIIKKLESYDFINFFRAIRLSKKQYNYTKKLAYSSLFSIFLWVIYFELDLIIIGRWFGIEEVATYAIGFTFLNFTRTLWGNVFSPFAQRFNHFVSKGQSLELKQMIRNLIDYTFPLCVIVTLTLFLSAEKIVLFWVGPEYYNSIIILKTLILGTGFSFILQPSSFYFTAMTKYKFIYLLAFIYPFIFLSVILFLGLKFGALGIAISKTITVFVGFIVSMIGLFSIINPIKTIQNELMPLLFISSCIFILIQKSFPVLFPYELKSKLHLLSLLLFIGIIIISSFLILLFVNKKKRKEIKLIFNKFLHQ